MGKDDYKGKSFTVNMMEYLLRRGIEQMHGAIKMMFSILRAVKNITFFNAMGQSLIDKYNRYVDLVTYVFC